MRERSPSITKFLQILPDLLDEMKPDFPYSSALYTERTGLSIALERNEERVTELKPSRGVAFSAFNGEHFAEVATGEINKKSLKRAVRELRSTLPVTNLAVPIDAGKPLRRHFTTPCRVDPQNVPLVDKLELVRVLHQKILAMDSRIVNARVTYMDAHESKVFSSHQRLLSQDLIRTSLGIWLYVSDGTNTTYNWLFQRGTRGFELTRVDDPVLETLVDDTIGLLSSQRIDPGMYTTIADPSVAGVIAHEAFGHGVEADMFLKGRARAQYYINRRVASPIVTMIDDPSIPGAYGSYFFDDEGEIARPTVIIEDGILRRSLTDLYSAYQLNIPRSANGRRESYERKVYARMSNTIFQPGEAEKEDLVAGISRGILLEKAESGMEDPKNWGIQVKAHLGREIRHGKLTGRIYSPVGITGYVPKLLKSISACSQDLHLEGGTCGKGHKELVPVADGGPYIVFRARLG
jgi:TldD protein